ncbi:MAG TPA: ABC transporter permease, partial [Gemmatimonadaceae bacterium]|nr:ABC transporter permease [Gemmatimonadaceae bacterium]
MLSELWSDIQYRLRALFRRDRVERELDDELRFHLERETDKLVAQGVPRREAERRARLAFGGLDRIKDDTRDSRGITLLDVVAQDIRYALRGLRRAPGFTIAIVLTLALGIGANAAMFGVIDRLLFRPPAFLHDPSSVSRVYLTSTFRGSPIISHTFEYKRYRDLEAWTSSVADVAAFATRPSVVGSGQDIHEMTLGIATASFFEFFDIQPEAGRFFTRHDDSLPAGPSIAVISHAFWQTRFGGRREAIGSRLQIGPTVVTIIGVAPDGFAGLAVGPAPVAWVPLTPYAATHKGFDTDYNWGWLEMVVRRKSGVSVASSTADFTTAYARSWLAERALDPSISPVNVARPAVVLAPTQFERGPEAGAAGRVAAWVSGVAL